MDRFIIEAGISSGLKEIFRSIADQDFDGQPRFRDRDCRELAKVVACRIYAKPLLELCHFVRAAGLLDRRRRYENLFWAVIPATPGNFRDTLGLYEAAAPEGLSISGDAVELTYPGGSFAVKYGRMPFLTVLMDFLVSALGYERCDEAFAGITTKDATDKDVSATAKELAKQVYHFLDDHLPSVQEQKKFRQVGGYLEARFGPGFTAGDIDDTCILEFWLEMSGLDGEEGGNFTGFPTAFDAFIRFVQAVDLGMQSSKAGYTGVIGSDREAGEIDPDSVQQLADLVLNEETSLLERLAEPPMDAVKFLNKRETELLAYVLPRYTEIARWTLSYLRSEVFGRGQARLSQALRNKVLADKLLALIEEAAPETYQDRVAAVMKVQTYLTKLLLACVYVLRRAEAEEDGVVDFATMGKARKAFHSISRQGFQEEGLDQSEIAEAFDLAPDCLTPINDRVVQLLEMLNSHGDLEAAFEADRPVFSKQFMTIYGEPV
ncbi:hypothetical protein [Aestuariispira ectoiniformans]|uniref:hypothetical protein n=1 Tax=Aestuariispira ectoiniformans TaxID=2775080 RepID=UPI00223AB8B8|nr:hypothetical protein [Aestuariispira ectoiniformans]